MNTMTETIVLCPVTAIAEGQIHSECLPDGTVIALYKVDGAIYATDDTCTHGAASLAEDGMLHGKEVECGFHFGRFDITTGAACASPCTVALKTYPVNIIDGMVSVELGEV